MTKSGKGRFKKGQSGNPSGRPKVPEDIRTLLSEKSNEYKRKFLFWCDAPVPQVTSCSGASWPITSMDRMICSGITQAMNGNYKAFEAILDRILGKSMQPLEHNLKDPFEDASYDELKKLVLEKLKGK